MFLNTIGAHIYASYIYIHFLADTKQDSSTKLEFKQRISIALGAAKGRLRETDITTVLDLIEPRKSHFNRRFLVSNTAGLCHLHGLKPPIIHKIFKTANVLVDEDFIAKVADAGISKLLEKIEEAGPSRTSSVNFFQDPE